MVLPSAATTAPPESPLRPSARWRYSILPTLFLIVATVAAYYPVHHHPFFSVDDAAYVTSNPRVLGPLNVGAVGWAFTHAYCRNYDPLTFLAHNLNVKLFQLDPRWHHDVNVLLHALDAVLLFWVLKRCTGYPGRSFMVAALFALHPMNVENVAWVAELKTLLSAGFFFLALGVYRWYALKPRRSRMAAVALAYGMGLLAKPQVITLPFLLLLWDYWPMRRMFGNTPDPSMGTTDIDVPAPSSISALIKEKIPLFAIALLDAVLTIFAEHESSPAAWPYTFAIRLGNGILSYSRYIGKALWPAHLSYLYPHPGYGLRWLLVWASLALLAAITALVFVNRRRRYLPVGWFWFLGTMVPMIGLIQIDTPAMADRWAYTSLAGLFLMMCWSVADWAEGHQLRTRLSRAAAVLVLIVLALMTRHQIGYWADDLNVWSHSIEVNGRNWMAEKMMGNVLAFRGHPDEALKHFYRAAEDAPDDVIVNLGIASSEQHLRNFRQALEYHNRVLRLSDDNEIKAQTWASMARAYNELGDSARARECFQNALRLHNSQPPATAQSGINWSGAWWLDLARQLKQILH